MINCYLREFTKIKIGKKGILVIINYGRDEIGSRGIFRLYLLRVRIPPTIYFTYLKLC